MDNQTWHHRFVLQMLWTKSLRAWLYKQLNLDSTSKILDVGCGTGALLAENLAITSATYAIDFDLSRCVYAHISNPSAKIANANAFSLPFPTGSFDLSFCHYLLLWIAKPVDVLREIRRVTQAGGTVVCFAEPDYRGRIDHPQIFKEIGELQNQSLRIQGVGLDTGRRLREYFLNAGFEEVNMGMLSGEWRQNTQEQFELEWQIIAHDLNFTSSQEIILNLQEKANEAWLKGDAFSFIPTFYAWSKTK